MRITFLLPHYGWQPSGGFVVVYTYAGIMAQRGHDVHVVHPRKLPPGGWPPPSGAIGRARRLAARARNVLLRPAYDWVDIDERVQLHYVPELTDAHVPDADAVVATWWSTAEAALTLAESKGERFHLIQGYEIWHGAEERVHAAWRAPLHKIFIARWLRDRALELGVAPDHTSLVPNAIDHDTFNLQRPIENRPQRVAMLYSTQSYKGGALGLEILKRAKESVPDLTASLFGVGRAPRDLPAWIRYTRSATPRQLADEVYNRAAVYLCPSLSEGWHLPPAEAMACGCALVSSDIGGVGDYAVAGETALLYPPGDEHAAADQVVKLLTDEAIRCALARRGAEKISEFSWAHSGDRFEAVLNRRLKE